MAVSSRDLSVRELAWDTRHFGVRMGILEPPEGASPLGTPEVTALVRTAVSQAATAGYQQLTARSGPWETAWIHALEAAGFRLVDTLVTWELALSALPSSRRPSVLTIRPAAATDLAALQAIAKQAFADRAIWLDRFHADPHISPERADALYEAWVQNSVNPRTPTESMADATFVAETHGSVAGFLTCRLLGAVGEPVGQVSLNAVEAAHRGQGVYRGLVDAALVWFGTQGCRRVQVRTNLASHPVHRTWQRLGAVMAAEEHTFHWWA